MRLVALGRTRMLYDTIHALREQGHDIAGIATCRAAPEYDVRESDFEDLAKSIGATFILTQDLNHATTVRTLRELKADVAVSVNWINIIGSEACESFQWGVLNAHAGDLPRYRGNAPVAWAILQGESKVGVTVHQMDPHELDAGPIILKEFVDISPRTYIGDVFKQLDALVPRMFGLALNGLQNGSLIPIPQTDDISMSLRCFPRMPEDGRVVWSQSADKLCSLVRASAEPFAGSFAMLQDKHLIIWRARAQNWPSPVLAVPGQVVGRRISSGEVDIATGDGVLTLEEVQIQGQSRCKPHEILRSLRDRLR